MSFSDDVFLGGQLKLKQPIGGYRAGADPVFLAAAVQARPGDSVLELGCGGGVAMMCLMRRVNGLRVTGVERNEDCASLAQENLARNGLDAELVTADIAKLPLEVTSMGFKHVMTNPPFFDREKGQRATETGREEGRGEDIPFPVWINQAIRRLLPGGTLTLIQRVERLPACLAALDSKVGDVTVLPMAPRRSRPPKLLILRGKKGARGPFQLCTPFVLHEGDQHAQGGDGYTEAAQKILRDGGALAF